MKREDLDKAINAINEEQRELENKISALKAKKKELQQQYVKEYPNLIKIGSKLRIKTKIRHWDNESIYENVVFVGSHEYLESYDCYCSFLHDDKHIGTRLLKIKKNGQASERVERVTGDIIEIEILEQ